MIFDPFLYFCNEPTHMLKSAIVALDDEEIGKLLIKNLPFSLESSNNAKHVSQTIDVGLRKAFPKYFV